MHRIHVSKLRVLLAHHNWRTVAVLASVGGGWLVHKPARIPSA